MRCSEAVVTSQRLDFRRNLDQHHRWHDEEAESGDAESHHEAVPPDKPCESRAKIAFPSTGLCRRKLAGNLRSGDGG